jgi:hypothetical protein
MTARNLHRMGGAIATMATDALTGPCGIGTCREPSVGYIQGISNRTVGVCGSHAEGATARGYVVHRDAPITRRGRS